MPTDLPNDPRRRLVTEKHFELLKNFGRAQLQKQLPDKEKEMLWVMSCRTARIAELPLELVVDVWKEFIGGLSKRSGIAINGEYDPQFTAVGVTYDKVLVAAHTTRTPALLERVLRIWRRVFSSDDEFMESVRSIALRSLEAPKKKRGGPR